MSLKNVITRFPPSPTGYLHIGGVRTALFNYLFARSQHGSMYLRFEDTDKDRSKKEFEEDIVKGLQWLNISYKMPDIPRQSERMDIYQKYFSTLLESGHAYEAEEGKDDPSKKIIRFKNPNVQITFTDLVRGDVVFDTIDLGDFVIAKSASEPLYHLAVVIDDHEMNVTHVIRGEDHISNTPRQILILEALGFTRPLYAHIPLILAPDKTKLSKRHGAVSINEYRAQGFIPEALLNYLALLGWNPGGEKEIFSLDELISAFSLNKIQKSGAVFTIEKLRWFNHEHLNMLSPIEFTERLDEYMRGRGETLPTFFPLISTLVRERSATFLDAADALTTEFNFMGDTVSYDAELLLKGAKAEREAVVVHLQKTIDLLSSIPGEDFTQEKVKEAIFAYATEVGRSAVLWPMRAALSGKEKSPDPFVLAGLLGKPKTLLRLNEALSVLK